MKIKYKKIILYLLTFLFLSSFIFSSYKILNYFMEHKKIEKQLKEINNLVKIYEITEDIEILDEDNKNNP